MVDGAVHIENKRWNKNVVCVSEITAVCLHNLFSMSDIAVSASSLFLDQNRLDLFHWIVCLPAYIQYSSMPAIAVIDCRIYYNLSFLLSPAPLINSF